MNNEQRVPLGSMTPGWEVDCRQTRRKRRKTLLCGRTANYREKAGRFGSIPGRLSPSCWVVVSWCLPQYFVGTGASRIQEEFPVLVGRVSPVSGRLCVITGKDPLPVGH